MSVINHNEITSIPIETRKIIFDELMKLKKVNYYEKLKNENGVKAMGTYNVLCLHCIKELLINGISVERPEVESKNRFGEYD